jgi:hypothetical protein
VLTAGLGLRLVLAYVVFPNQGLSTDMTLFASWASTLARVGPGQFYASAAGANYAPGYLYILWPLGIAGNFVGSVLGLSTNQGIVELLKVPAILADLAIGVLLYRAAARWISPRAGLVAAALYLFIPVTWYDSALWGQVDAVGTLAMLGAVLLLIDGWSEPAAALAGCSVLIKPQDAIGLVVVIPILVRRHLLRPGSGPMRQLGPRLARVDRALGGLLSEQGPVRLGTSALACALAIVVPLLPFDMLALAPASLADVPVVGHVAGLISLVTSAADQFSVLTVNAYNAWALMGDPSLAAAIGGSGGTWIADSLPVVAGIPAYLVAAAALTAVSALVVVGLLRSDSRVAILLGFAIMALAFYAVPTRVHERYLLPFFAPAALLAAMSIRLVGGYVGIGVLNAVNIHAVLGAPLTLGGGFGGFGGRGSGGFGGAGGGGRIGFGGGSGSSGITAIRLPFTDLARSEVVVTALALGQTAALVLLLGVWAYVALRPRLPELGTSTTTTAPPREVSA